MSGQFYRKKLRLSHLPPIGPRAAAADPKPTATLKPTTASFRSRHCSYCSLDVSIGFYNLKTAHCSLRLTPRIPHLLPTSPTACTRWRSPMVKILSRSRRRSMVRTAQQRCLPLSEMACHTCTWRQSQTAKQRGLTTFSSRGPTSRTYRSWQLLTKAQVRHFRTLVLSLP